MLRVLFVILICFISSSQSDDCPAIYIRYSTTHSYCKPPNPTCSAIRKGVTSNDVPFILSLHNDYRNKIALGLETSGGGLPPGSDMMQMVWDEELAAIAQKWAEQCTQEHDCRGCRDVRNFEVGQNIGYVMGSCSKPDCFESSAPTWNVPIKIFYDEIDVFDKKYLKSMFFPEGITFGHFTQVAWAKTWRIGCGFVAFRKDDGYGQIYVCNYGPKGNMINEPLYTEGPPCSSCPKNSCCGPTCLSADFPSLCKMQSDSPPAYRPKDNFIYDCEFETMSGDCSISMEGKKNLELVESLGGRFVEIVLNGGETSTLKFEKPIKPTKSFCLMLQYRTGPTVANEKFANSMVLNCQLPDQSQTVNMPTKSDLDGFFSFNVDLSWKFETKISITLSVPANMPPQYFDIKQVSAKEGSC